MHETSSGPPALGDLEAIIDTYSSSISLTQSPFSSSSASTSGVS